jgi:hypothetical protein
MNAINPTLVTVKDYDRHLDAVNSMNRITNRMGIDEAVKYCQLLLASL